MIRFRFSHQKFYTLVSFVITSISVHLSSSETPVHIRVLFHFSIYFSILFLSSLNIVIKYIFIFQGTGFLNRYIDFHILICFTLEICLWF